VETGNSGTISSNRPAGAAPAALHWAWPNIFCSQGFTLQYGNRIVRAIDDASGRFAQMVKLVDTPASGVGGLTAVEVRVFFWAPFSNARLPESPAFQKPAKAGFCVSGVSINPVRIFRKGLYSAD
jgi:hypothetical protein